VRGHLIHGSNNKSEVQTKCRWLSFCPPSILQMLFAERPWYLCQSLQTR
jgi:hypothetical protein